MIQVIGTKKCQLTQKSLRFFKERGVTVHFMDLSTRPISAGELDNCVRALGSVEKLLDRAGPRWKARGLEHMVFNVRDELLADSALLLTPIVRQGKATCIGLDESGWQRLAEAEKA